jgi:hypothetical protein
MRTTQGFILPVQTDKPGLHVRVRHEIESPPNVVEQHQVQIYALLEIQAH